MPRQSAGTLARFNPLAEILGMDAETLTDRMLLNLHLRQLKSAGQLPNSLRAREGALLRLSRALDPPQSNPRILIEATSADLANWQADISHLSLATIDKYVMHTSAFYSWLVRPMRVLKESPAEDLMRPNVKRLLPRPISEDDLAYALDACTDQLVFVWMILGAYAGLRAVDISALHCDDILLNGSVPFLRVRGKGGHEKLVAVGIKVVEVLAAYSIGRGPMFVNGQGKRLAARTIDERINAYLKRVGVPCTFHQFRHYYGTAVYEITKDIIYTQKQMRHASVSSTQIYTLVSQDRNSEALKTLDDKVAQRVQTRQRRRA
jgi:integrase